MPPAGSQSIGTTFCDTSGVRSMHSLLGLGHDPSGVTEHRNHRRTKVFDPPYGGSQRRRDSPAYRIVASFSFKLATSVACCAIASLFRAWSSTFFLIAQTRSSAFLVIMR